MHRYWHDAFVQIDDFTNEGVVASSSWPFQVNLLRARTSRSPASIPEEGATGWADTTMMHGDAAHPNCAYMWLEHSLSPKVQGDLAAWFGSVPAVPAACKGNELSGPRAARPTAWTTSTASASGARRRQMRQPAGRLRPYYRWVTDYIAVFGGR